MNDFKQTVKEFLDNNDKVAEYLMREGKYEKEWTSEDGWGNDFPFEYQGVDSYGGEDCGSDYWTVIRVRSVDEPISEDSQHLLVKLQGWYASYEGSDYSGWSFVEPKQKTITVYE